MSAERGTVFWKVAPPLAAVLVATALLSTALSAALFRDASADLVRDGLTLRLDRLAEEFEARAAWSPGDDPLDDGRFDVPRRLRLDLATRLRDPIYLVDPQGTLRHIPDGTVYDQLYDDWNYRTLSDIELSSCWPYPPRKYPLNDAHLVKTDDSTKVYIYDAHYKRYRWIVDGYTFATKYGFSWDKVRTLELDPESVNWSWPWD